MEGPVHKNNLRKNETETQIILANTIAYIFTVLLSSVRVINCIRYRPPCIVHSNVCSFPLLVCFSSYFMTLYQLLKSSSLNSHAIMYVHHIFQVQARN